MSAYWNHESRKTQQEREAEMVHGILGPMFPHLFASVQKPDDTLPWDGMEDDDVAEEDIPLPTTIPLGPIPRDPLRQLSDDEE